MKAQDKGSVPTMVRVGTLPRTGRAPVARALGVGDWAWRKGRRYGTVLVGLERRCVLGLRPDLPGR